MFGSTSPLEYPSMSWAKKSPSRISLSVSRSKKGIFLAANLTACSFCFCPSPGSSPPALLGQAMRRICGLCPFSVGFAQNSGAILLAQLAGNHARREELQTSTIFVFFLLQRLYSSR